MYKLPKISYCGLEFNHIKWGSHAKKCEICKKEIAKELEIIEKLKKEWSYSCDCGCGCITEYNNTYIKFHHRRNKKQTEEHKLNKLNSWRGNGNSEKLSERLKDNNPCFSEKSINRMKNDNPAKKEEVRKKISENNPMKNPMFRKKAYDNYIKKYGKDFLNNKLKEVMMLKYGVEHPSHVKDILEKRINTYTQRLSEGKYKIKNNWVCGNFLRKNGETEWYDSSFEFRKMTQYDNDNINWTKKHKIRIPYINSNNLNSHYVPDFLIEVNNEKILVETKGWVKDDDILKAKEAIIWCNKNNFQYYFLLGINMDIETQYSYITKEIKYK